jgi:hypothetical protein
MTDWIRLRASLEPDRLVGEQETSTRVRATPPHRSSKVTRLFLAVAVAAHGTQRS